MALEAKVKLTLVDKVTNKINQINSNINKMNTLANRSGSTMMKWPKVLAETANQAKKMRDEFKKNNTVVSGLSRKLKSLFSAYAGVMTIKAVVETSDIITGAENRLNYANGGDKAATEQSMDKIYAASQRARTGYADMLGNVGKSMALAGDTAFKGNVDNAIKFQEIMAKAYAIGGASAAEQSSSMYQMVQALGSGILQGDELRSVREGAPLAYREIEKFAQKLLETDESLKELASDGKITSDIVVAAMLDAGDSIDEAFGKTDMTIAQAFGNIKNTAVNSFRTIQDTINGFLNSETGAKFVEGISIAVQGLIGILNALVTVFVNVLTWMVDNWSWLQYIVYGVAAAVIFLAVVAIGQNLVQAILLISTANPFIWWAIGIEIVIAAIVWLANTAADGCDFVYQICYALAVAIVALMAVVFAIYLATGTLMLSVPVLIVLAIIAVVALLVMAIAKYGEQIGAVIAGAASVVWNIFVTLVAGIIQNALMPFATAWDTFANFFGNIFNDPIAAIIHNFETLANSVLGILKTIASGIDAIFGSNLAGAVEGWMGKVSSKANALADKYGNGTYEKKSDTVNALNDIMSGAVDKYTWDTSLAINQGAAVGAGAQNWINSTFDKAKNGLSSLGSSITGSIDKDLNIDRNFDPNSSQYALNPNTYDPDELKKGIGNIDKNTGKIKDSMDLTAEDLEYLRKVADMEWKKEFTTANITVDMSNYNTINGDGDLDGIVTRLADRLYEEMDAVANGVYA